MNIITKIKNRIYHKGLTNECRQLSRRHSEKGGILIQVIAFMTIGTLILSGFVGWGVMSVRTARHTEEREQAIQIAEAGIDYYRWHLAHAPADFQDGTGGPGPYVHTFYDKSGNQIGNYSLSIQQPQIGSTLVNIIATGTILADPTIHRTIQTKLGKPSFAKFAVLSNSDMSIGADIFGPMHSNGGIYFVSGVAHNIVTSAKTTFNSTTTGGTTQWGVYAATPVDPVPPTPFTSVNATFLAGRQVGIPALDFAGVTVDLASLQAASSPSYAASGAFGYHIVLKTTDKYDIYRVDTLATGGAGCQGYVWWTYPSCPIVANSSWSINTQTLLSANVSFPANGIIFAADNIWVDGTIDTARLTIVAATLPDLGVRKNIIVTNNLLYTHKDGRDVIGLIAQDNFWVGLVTPNNLEVDAAIIAQNGRVSRYAYNSSCGGNDVRGTITLYGMFASNQRYAYGNLGSGCVPGVGLSGFQTNRVYIYDPNLLYGPPPSFPLTADQYQILSWDEI